MDGISQGSVLTVTSSTVTIKDITKEGCVLHIVCEGLHICSSQAHHLKRLDPIQDQLKGIQIFNTIFV